MPLTPELRQSIDQIRDYLYGGGYPDPVSNAEQLAFLFFFYLAEGLARLASKAKYQNPDALPKPSAEIEKLIPEFQKQAAARRMGELLSG